MIFQRMLILGYRITNISEGAQLDGECVWLRAVIVLMMLFSEDIDISSTISDFNICSFVAYL